MRDINACPGYMLATVGSTPRAVLSPGSLYMTIGKPGYRRSRCMMPMGSTFQETMSGWTDSPVEVLMSPQTARWKTSTTTLLMKRDSTSSITLRAKIGLLR